MPDVCVVRNQVILVDVMQHDLQAINTEHSVVQVHKMSARRSGLHDFVSFLRSGKGDK